VRSHKLNLRIAIGVICLTGLVAVFIFQKFDFTGWIGIHTGNTVRFILNRSIRFIINDGLAIGLIFAIFYERKYVLFAIVIQIIGLFLFLLPYFILKINYPSYNGPLISYLHRLILNPTLLMLLIPAFYFQKIKGRNINE